MNIRKNRISFLLILLTTICATAFGMEQIDAQHLATHAQVTATFDPLITTLIRDSLNSALANMSTEELTKAEQILFQHGCLKSSNYPQHHHTKISIPPKPLQWAIKGVLSICVTYSMYRFCYFVGKKIKKQSLKKESTTLSSAVSSATQHQVPA